MTLPSEEAEVIVCQDHDDYDFIEERILGKGRWTTEYEGIFLNNKTGKYYRVFYSRGSTESQDTELFYDGTVNFEEVERKQVLVERWVSV